MGFVEFLGKYFLAEPLSKYKFKLPKVMVILAAQSCKIPQRNTLANWSDLFSKPPSENLILATVPRDDPINVSPGAPQDIRSTPHVLVEREGVCRVRVHQRGETGIQAHVGPGPD